MVSVLESGLMGSFGLSFGWDDCVGFLDKTVTLHSKCLSPPRSINGYRRFVSKT